MASSVDTIETGIDPDDPVSMQIVQRIATATGKEVTRLPPLYQRIDPDALDAVVNSVDAGPSPLSIRFTYAGHQITITGSGSVSIESEQY